MHSLAAAAAAVAALAGVAAAGGLVSSPGGGGGGVGTYFCEFVYTSQTCPTAGPCCLNSSVVDSGSRAGDPSYNLAFCQVTSGTGQTACGVVAKGPAYEFATVYGSACNSQDAYACQYVDPSLVGGGSFPGLLSCINGKCLAQGQQLTGDPCTINSECVSNTCGNGVCTGLPSGATCAPGACAEHLWCNIKGGNTCQPRTLSGGTCSTLGQCERGNLCDLQASPAKCTPIFSVPNGQKVNSADLCASGAMDNNNLCVDLFTGTGQVCDCSLPVVNPATKCACSNVDMCVLRPSTLRTPRMVAARKAARTCFDTALAADGTLCTDPWTNEGAGNQVTQLGTCAYLHCHKTLSAWWGSDIDLVSGNYSRLEHQQPCAQTVAAAFYAAATRSLISCSLPAAWRAKGWNCDADVPPGNAPNKGMSPGGAAALSLFIIALVGFCGWATWALYTGRAPAWLSNAAARVSGCFGRSSGYGKVGATSASSGSSSLLSQGVGSAYASTKPFNSSAYGSA